MTVLRCVTFGPEKKMDQDQSNSRNACRKDVNRCPGLVGKRLVNWRRAWSLDTLCELWTQVAYWDHEKENLSEDFQISTESV